MTKPLKRVAITGAGGQIAYNLLFRVASGEMLGLDQPLALHLLELPSGLEALKGVVMELEDCAYPLLKEIRIGSDPQVLFGDVDYALLVGSKPRGPGMERKELLSENGQIFVQQGKALDAVASKDALVFAVGNPANTNCLIALHQAKRLSRHHFFSMMRLDQNRAQAMLAAKAQKAVSDVSSVTVWGNHSATQVPDFAGAKIGNKSALEVIGDRHWCEEIFTPAVQKRGAAVIAARGKSSAASAAHAVIGSIRSLILPSKSSEIFSVGLLSDGNPYGIAEDLVFSFPCRSLGGGKVQIVPGLLHDAFIKHRVALTEQELLEERALITHFF